MKKNPSDHSGIELPSATETRIGIVVSQWNKTITDILLAGAKEVLVRQGIQEDNLLISQVPGSFELPSGAQYLLEKHDPDAVIILGCVIQGETRHFDFICQGVTQGIMDLNLQYKKPVIFGLLTTDTMEQAQDRSGGEHGNKGTEAAVTALQMIHLWKSE